MEPRISFVTLGVGDLQRSTAFYIGLGLPREGAHEGVTFFKLRGLMFSLFPRADLADDAGVAAGPDDSADTTGGFPGFALAHNVASKTAVDELLRFAEGAGARITRAARDTNWGGYSGYFADPDGFLWEIAWNPHFELD